MWQRKTTSFSDGFGTTVAIQSKAAFWLLLSRTSVEPGSTRFSTRPPDRLEAQRHVPQRCFSFGCLHLWGAKPFGEPQSWSPFRPVSWQAIETADVAVPACSVCGMAVDWLRSCYQSEWALFKDAPTTLIRGRYYFSPPKTGFYAGTTLLASRVGRQLHGWPR